MVLFHSTERSNRLEYIVGYILGERLGLDFRFAGPNEAETGAVHICYTEAACSEGIHIIPQGLLSEAGLPANAGSGWFCHPFGEPGTLPEDGLFPDIFSAAFYHLSRCEEYRTSKDKHGRFSHKTSCLYLNGLLETPVVDVWIEKLRERLIREDKSGKLRFRETHFHTLPGIDIDSVFAYRGRSLFRTVAAIGRDLLRRHWSDIRERIRVLGGRQKDPNDNFGLQQEILGAQKAVYFIQVGPYGPHDKNIQASHPDFRNLVQDLKHRGHSIALHPSYRSDSDPSGIGREKSVLEAMCGQPVLQSRQHYLRFRLPETYRSLIACGILEEHSMGYSEVAGFRAGTAFPFPWYDLEKETQTPLTIFPFSVMDVAYKQFAGMDAESAIRATSGIKETCRALRAPFAFVFHNESLSGHRGWENWNKVFTYWCHE